FFARAPSAGSLPEMRDIVVTAASMASPAVIDPAARARAALMRGLIPTTPNHLNAFDAWCAPPGHHPACGVDRPRRCGSGMASSACRRLSWAGRFLALAVLAPTFRGACGGPMPYLGGSSLAINCSIGPIDSLNSNQQPHFLAEDLHPQSLVTTRNLAS